MWSLFWQCITCSFHSSLRINGEDYSIVKLLGDGGYAYVYLVKQAGSNKELALKKISCMFGGESVANAVREIEACHVFTNSDLVVSCIDSAVVQEQDGTKTVYIIMPLYPNGSLQDKINENIVNDTTFSETEVITYALGIARALEVMHTHRSNGSQTDSLDTVTSSNPEEQALLNDREELEDVALGDLVPYAHRDVKPANIMLNADSVVGSSSSTNVAVLIDLGSCSPARVDVASRQQAVEIQDLAASHCTLPFRAPELFDVRTGSQLTEKVDVWGFGCTLYTIMYSASPFEREELVSGANINIAIARGKFSFPVQPSYSAALKEIVTNCLQVKPDDRPSITNIIGNLEAILN